MNVKLMRRMKPKAIPTNIQIFNFLMTKGCLIMRNSLVKYIVDFSQNMLGLIMCVLYAIAYLIVKLLPITVLTFWLSVGIVALNGESEFMSMPIGRIALIGVVATIAAIILGVAATTLLESITTELDNITAEDDADTK